MNFKDALRSMSQLQALTKAMLMSNIIMAVGLTYAIFAVSGQRERVVLVPPALDRRAEIAWQSADKEYLKSFGLYIATLVGNIQPKSSSLVLDSVSQFMDPKIYTDFRRQMLSIIEDPQFKSSGATISFQPNSLQWEGETSRVFVTGTLITASSGTQKYQKQVTYEVGLAIREGRPWVTHFLSYEGNIPRTVTWHLNQAQRDKKSVPDYANPQAVKRSVPDSNPSDMTDLSAMRTSIQPADGQGHASGAPEASDAGAAPASDPHPEDIIEKKE